MALMDDWLMDFVHLLFVDHRLVMLVNHLLMVLVDHIFVMLMHDLLVMFVNDITMGLFHNGSVDMHLNTGCHRVLFNDGGFHVSLDNSGLLMSDYSSLRELLLNNWLLLDDPLLHELLGNNGHILDLDHRHIVHLGHWNIRHIGDDSLLSMSRAHRSLTSQNLLLARENLLLPSERDLMHIS